jgi:GAF domain-containing protein
MMANVTHESPASLLGAVQRRLALARGQDDIIATIRATVRALLGADGVTFVLREKALCHYVEEDAIAPLWKGHKFPMDSCISGWAMTHNRTAAVPDIRIDPRIPQDLYRATFVRSLLMTPIGTATAVAALGAYWAAPRNFSPGDVAAMEGVAALISRSYCRLAA